MNATSKVIITLFTFLTSIFMSFAASADNFVFSGKNAYGSMYSSEGPLSLGIDVYENSTQSKSQKASSVGAYFNGSYFNGSECWYGYASLDVSTFNVSGSLPKKLTASGSGLVTWYEYCSLNIEMTDTVEFSMDMRSITDQAYQSRGNSHNQYGDIKVNSHYDYSSSPADVTSSSVTSQFFGVLTPS
ncbi:MAG: hypothetical protein OEX07_05300, partial [Gammaproteobacteria bacterium]|nr:hypothetical protein [Gammaproteobacteria bacterium]